MFYYGNLHFILDSIRILCDFVYDLRNNSMCISQENHTNWFWWLMGTQLSARHIINSILFKKTSRYKTIFPDFVFGNDLLSYALQKIKSNKMSFRCFGVNGSTGKFCLSSLPTVVEVLNLTTFSLLRNNWIITSRFLDRLTTGGSLGVHRNLISGGTSLKTRGSSFIN